MLNTLKKNKILLIILSVVVMLIVIISSIISEKNINHQIYCLFNIEDYYYDIDYKTERKLVNKPKVKRKILKEINLCDDYEQIVNISKALNDGLYSEDEELKNAIITKLKEILKTSNISEKLQVYVALEKAEPKYSEKFIYANINDVISKEDFENEISHSLNIVKADDFSSENKKTGKAFISGSIGDMNINLYEDDVHILYYKNNAVYLSDLESYKEDDFVIHMNSIDENTKVYFNGDCYNPIIVTIKSNEICTSKGNIYNFKN